MVNFLHKINFFFNKNFGVNYPTPINLSYLWGGICLVLMYFLDFFVTGLLFSFLFIIIIFIGNNTLLCSGRKSIKQLSKIDFTLLNKSKISPELKKAVLEMENYGCSLITHKKALQKMGKVVDPKIESILEVYFLNVRKLSNTKNLDPAIIKQLTYNFNEKYLEHVTLLYPAGANNAARSTIAEVSPTSSTTLPEEVLPLKGSENTNSWWDFLVSIPFERLVLVAGGAATVFATVKGSTPNITTNNTYNIEINEKPIEIPKTAPEKEVFSYYKAGRSYTQFFKEWGES